MRRWRRDKEDQVTHDQEFWEEPYRSVSAVWSKHPNAALVAEASDLPPGAALDVGCGEGADAIWLAERGWRVMAVDWASAALQRGADEATSRGDDVAGRISWQPVDVTTWTPEGSYDLVTSAFLHIPRDDRHALFARLADAVAPGGALLVFGHHPSEREIIPRDRPAELFFSPEEIIEFLEPASWEVLVAEARTRNAHDHDHDHGAHSTQFTDTVVRARRRGR